VSRATLFRKERRARGLCAVAGCPEHTGEDYRCPRHAEAHRKAMKEAYHANLAMRAALEAAADRLEAGGRAA
jgi:hypothetical protein